jgi:hypothetical protein
MQSRVGIWITRMASVESRPTSPGLCWRHLNIIWLLARRRASYKGQADKPCVTYPSLLGLFSCLISHAVIYTPLLYMHRMQYKNVTRFNRCSIKFICIISKTFSYGRNAYVCIHRADKVLGFFFSINAASVYINSALTMCEHFVANRGVYIHVICIYSVKVKLKFTVEQATKVQRGSKVMALLFL